MTVVPIRSPDGKRFCFNFDHITNKGHLNQYICEYFPRPSHIYVLKSFVSDLIKTQTKLFPTFEINGHEACVSLWNAEYIQSWGIRSYEEST